jgi:hypothetical protein
LRAALLVILAFAMDGSVLSKTVVGLLATVLLGADAKDLIRHVQAMRDATDFRATGRLVRVDGEQRKNYQFSMRAKGGAGALKIFCEVTGPAPSRVRLLLESFPGGRSVIRTGHPGDRAPSELPYERWGESLLNTDFSFEDLMESQFLWQIQSLMEETMYGARACFVVKSQPGPTDRTHYATVTSWLDREVYYPVKVEKVVKSSGAVKEFTFYGLRQSKGIWSASQIECKTKGKPGSTLLIISRGSAKAHVDESAFDPALLIKP